LIFWSLFSIQSGIFLGYISSRDLQPFSVARLLEAWKKAMWRLHFLWWLETKPEVGLSGRLCMKEETWLQQKDAWKIASGL
jgi:hypothetical protein